MIKTRPVIFILSACTSVILGALPLQAQSGRAVRATGVHSNNDQGFKSQSYNSGLQLGLDSSFAYSSGFITSAITGTTVADFGINRISNSVSIPDGNGEYASSYLTSAWVDAITIDGGVRNGQSGVFQGVLNVHMAYSDAGTPYYTQSNDFGVSVGTSMGAGDYAFLGFSGTAEARSYDNVPLPFSIGFTFGVPFNVAVTMYSSINISVNTYWDGGTITHAASNTVSWGGVVSIQDQASQTLGAEDYSLGSSSGTNYAAPVPEPSAGLLAIVVGGLFAGIRRRPRQ